MTADNSDSGSCTFVRSDGTKCPGVIEAEGGAFCFWHDREVSKEGNDVKARLEEWAESGESMEGFVLRFAHLEGVHLNSSTGRDLRGANLFRLALQGAH